MGVWLKPTRLNGERSGDHDLTLNEGATAMSTQISRHKPTMSGPRLARGAIVAVLLVALLVGSHGVPGVEAAADQGLFLWLLAAAGCWLLLD
jgi:hypothetical protein